MERRVLEMANDLRAQRGVVRLKYDGLLSTVARAHSRDMAAHNYFDDFSPRLGSMEYRMRCAGSSAASTRVGIYQAPSIERLRAKLGEGKWPLILGDGTHMAVGVASAGRPRGHLVTLILTERLTKLAPFPCTIAPGRTWTLSGRLGAGLRSPRVAVSLPNGSVEEMKVETLQDGSFSCDVAFAAGKGAYTVEVVGNGRLGPVVTDVFVVYAGVPWPRPKGRVRPKAAATRDLNAAARQMLALVNRERAAHGLAGLDWDGRLAAVALSHSSDMAENGFFAHVSPRRGDQSARMKRAGIQARLFTENIALNESVEKAHASLMASPVHRKNILGPRVERLGIGIFRRGDGQLYITQNFAQSFATVDTRAASAELLAGINRQRRARGCGLLQNDRASAEVALANSGNMLKLGKLDTTRAKELLKSGPLRYRSWAMLVYVSDSPPKPSRLPETLEKRFHAIGIGMVQDDSAKDGPKRVWTTLLLAVKQ